MAIQGTTAPPCHHFSAMTNSQQDKNGSHMWSPQIICCLQKHGDMCYMLRWLTAAQEAEIDFVFLKKTSHMIWDLLCIETVPWDCAGSITFECLMQSKEKRKFRAQFFFQHFYCKVTTLPSSSCVISWGQKKRVGTITYLTPAVCLFKPVTWGLSGELVWLRSSSSFDWLHFSLKPVSGGRLAVNASDSQVLVRSDRQTLEIVCFRDIFFSLWKRHTANADIKKLL